MLILTILQSMQNLLLSLPIKKHYSKNYRQKSANSFYKPLRMGGPIVMNTQEEIKQAFSNPRNNQFLKNKIDYKML